MAELTHFDESGASRMVDVTDKDVTLRTARASGRVRLAPATLALVMDRRMAKGDVLEVARLAGIMAAKRTGELDSALPSAGTGQHRAHARGRRARRDPRSRQREGSRPHGRGDGSPDGRERGRPDRI